MDPIADMIVIIKNGYLARKGQVVLPYSKFRLQLAKVLEESGFLKDVSKEKNKLNIGLIYNEDKKPKITEIKKVSKQGLRSYVKAKNINPIKGGRGIIVVSTSGGVITGTEAKKRKLGGEVICQVW